MDMGWKLPKKGWVKVNVHGVYYQTPLTNGTRSGVGVVVRNEDGDIIVMVSGTLNLLNERVNDLWALLMGLRCCLYAGKHKVILETESGDAVREWQDWRWFINPSYSDVIESLVKRTDDERLELEVSVVTESSNHLARYLAIDGAVNRSVAVMFTRPFGRVRDLWHRDMGLGTTEFGFDLYTEEEYRKMQEGD
ncbi:hypothetical protein DCAR_0208086 [Daucus carota subsp. sativus]|uniref:Uncharacterized protein n=1 Tax=Daucus carota subsp. sativus TaxID=79200 RepID=A0A166EB80_DAUCS|nr:hypothetical protein DCAR_0208086 [Daucus carota subsp. sativus]